MKQQAENIRVPFDDRRENAVKQPPKPEPRTPGKWVWLSGDWLSAMLSLLLLGVGLVMEAWNFGE